MRSFFIDLELNKIKEYILVKQSKIDKVKEIVDLFTDKDGILFTDHTGLKAQDAVMVRDRLVEAGSNLMIAKNTLSALAAKEYFKDLDIEEVFEGPTSIVTCSQDTIETIKILVGLRKDLETLKIKAGIFEDQVLTTKQINKMAKLPPREQLLGQVVVTLNSPISKLVNTLNAMTSNLVMVLEAIRKEKENSN